MSWRPFALWISASAMFNLAWELAQLPLYTLYREASPAAIAYAIAHCTAGDVLIAAAAYGAASLASATAAWPFTRPRFGTAVAIAGAVAYTALSEWLNVYVRQSWAYTDSMPQLFGIGLSPLVQWIAVPAAATLLSRALGSATFGRGS